jgi:hypothetical protein
MKPYTYTITHKLSGVKYYGVRYSKNCQPNDLGISYFSSSKTLRKMILNEGKDNFEFKIRQCFENKEDAVLWEHKVLRRLNAAQSTKWFNRHNGNTSWHNVGGYKLSEVTRERMRKPKSEEHRKRLKSHLDVYRSILPWTAERKRSYSTYMLGNTQGFKKGHVSWNKGRKFDMPCLIGNKNAIGKHKCREVVCPHCNLSGKGPNMTRYHFDNCNVK